MKIPQIYPGGLLKLSPIYFVFLSLFLYFYNLYNLLTRYFAIYGVNDDRLLNDFVDGSYLGEGISNLTYIHPFLGRLLVLLYELDSGTPWYGLLLIFALIISLIGTLLLSFKINRDSKFLYFAWTISSILITNWYVLNPTFTAASIIITSFGYFWLLTILNCDKATINIARIIVPILVISLGYLLRVKGFQSSSLVWLPLLTIVIFKKIIQKKLNLKFNIVVLLILPILTFVFSSIFTSYEWKNFNTYNNLRQEIVNTSRLIEINKNEIGSQLQKGDLHNFENYNYFDKDLFSPNLLIRLIEISDNSQGISGLINPSVDVYNRLFNLDRFKFLLICILAFPLSLLSFINKNRMCHLFQVFLIILFTSFSLYYILATGKVEERVVIPLLINIWFITFSFPVVLNNHEVRKRLPILFLFCALFLVSFSKHIHEPTYFKERSKWNKGAIEFAEAQFLFLNDFGNDAIFVGPVSSIRNNWSSPYSISNSTTPKFISLGWHNFSPAWYKHNEIIFKNSGSIQFNLLNRKNVFYISDPDSAMNLFESLIAHKKISKYPKLISTFGDSANDYGGKYNIFSFSYD